jgi:hypothetical protein
MTNYNIIKEIYKISKELEKQSAWDRDGEEAIEKIIELIEKKRPHLYIKNKK